MAGSKEKTRWELEAAEPKPRVTFFQPRVSQVLVLYSLFGGNESALRRFLPKSHLAKVIMRDNSSVQRVQDVKLKHIEDSKRKMGGMCDQQKKKFFHDQQKKLTQWKKEYGRVQRMLQQMEERAKKPSMSLSRPPIDIWRTSDVEWKPVRLRTPKGKRH